MKYILQNVQVSSNNTRWTKMIIISCCCCYMLGCVFYFYFPQKCPDNNGKIDQITVLDISYTYLYSYEPIIIAILICICPEPVKNTAKLTCLSFNSYLTKSQYEIDFVKCARAFQHYQRITCHICTTKWTKMIIISCCYML